MCAITLCLLHITQPFILQIASTHTTNIGDDARFDDAVAAQAQHNMAAPVSLGQACLPPPSTPVTADPAATPRCRKLARSDFQLE